MITVVSSQSLSQSVSQVGSEMISARKYQLVDQSILCGTVIHHPSQDQKAAAHVAAYREL